MMNVNLGVEAISAIVLTFPTVFLSIGLIACYFERKQDKDGGDCLGQQS